ncbi:MAG: hypothetical protein DYG89_42065 [Caldilinea sp. CFX5]|nr:hypothetical protein [Caldilinea sp. CFX5]
MLAAWRCYRCSWLWLFVLLLLYLLLAGYQLGLPGLHYDEAREAGVNAMELLTGAPVTAFRQVTFPVAGLTLPVMVQDYIGALNVYLVLPPLWLTGVGIPNLRIVPLLTGLASLLLLERAVTAWWAWRTNTPPATRLPLSPAGLLAIGLLVASPSFVFWSRQGIFVTNLTQPLTFWCLWQGVRWLHTGGGRNLLWSAFAGGCALYAKLLALWVIGPFALFAAGWWLWQRWQRRAVAPLSGVLLVGVVFAFLLPLTPLLFFNWQSGGVWRAFAEHLDTSYYGVANRDLIANLTVRSRQVVQTLEGRHFWYLGGLYGNAVAPWLAVVSVGWGLWHGRRLLLGPLLLGLAAFACSLFTISDLFITHYALLHPLFIGIVALGLTVFGVPVKSGAIGTICRKGGSGRSGRQDGSSRKMAQSRPDLPGEPLRKEQLTSRPLRWLLALIIALWLGADLSATVRYHLALTRSGGLGDHSDVSYHLAYHLRYHGLGAPIALDWGFDAPVRYLSEGTVTPIEIFGYGSPVAPDPAFGERLRTFLGNPDNVYLLHTPAATSFQGRREAFFAEVNRAGRQARLETTFAQRDGAPLVELWRVLPP